MGKDAVIADRDPVGVSAEVLQDSFGAIEGRFAIDNPLLVVEMSPEGFKGFWFFELTDTAGEYNIISLETFLKKIKELAPEQCRHDSNGNKESLPA
jgi:hypothetical protein